MNRKNFEISINFTWDTFRSSTRNVTIICDPPISMLAMLESYWCILNQYSFRFSTSFRQKKPSKEQGWLEESIHCLLSSFSLFLVIGMNFLYTYNDGSTFTINSASSPLHSMIISSSVSACRNAPGMLIITTFPPLWASITLVIKTFSVITAGGAASSLMMYYCCLLSLTQALAFTLTHLFFVRNMRDASIFCFLFPRQWQCLDWWVGCRLV